MTWLAALAAEILARFWRPILAAVSAMAAYLRGRRDAKAAAEARAVETERDAAKARLEVVETVRDTRPDELRAELLELARRHAIGRVVPRYPAAGDVHGVEQDHPDRTGRKSDEH